MSDKARVSSVVIAGRSVECLMLPSGEFRIGVSQLPGLLSSLSTSERQDNLARDVQRILGKSSENVQTLKVASELNNRPVTTITLEQFRSLLVKLTTKGDATAIEMLDNLADASLISIVNHAFGVVFEQHKVVEYVASRFEHYRNFHPRFTAWLKLDGCKNYGRAVNMFKLRAGLPIKPVDEYTNDELLLLNKAEEKYHTLRNCTDFTHDEVMKKFS
jgi:hypothetical protein